MHISSRGELVNLINKSSVETSPINSDIGVKMFNSIVEVKSRRRREKSKFYRIKWGEIKDGNDTSHLWYNPDGVQVYLNSYDWAPGWKTKEEIKEIKLAKERLESLYQMHDCIVDNVEKNVIGANPPDDFENDTLTVMGTGPGGGKTEYASGRTARAIAKDQSVLFFSTNNSEEEVRERLLRTMTKRTVGRYNKRIEIYERDEEKLNESAKFIEDSNLVIIDNSYLLDEHYIIQKIRDTAKEEKGLDLVVIDYLEMILHDDELSNYESIVRIHKRLDNLAKELKFRVLITTQIQDA